MNNTALIKVKDVLMHIYKADNYKEVTRTLKKYKLSISDCHVILELYNDMIRNQSINKTYNTYIETVAQFFNKCGFNIKYKESTCGWDITLI